MNWQGIEQELFAVFWVKAVLQSWNGSVRRDMVFCIHTCKAEYFGKLQKEFRFKFSGMIWNFNHEISEMIRYMQSLY